LGSLIFLKVNAATSLYISAPFLNLPIVRNWL
jgi:hypothetical protein